MVGGAPYRSAARLDQPDGLAGGRPCSGYRAWPSWRCARPGQGLWAVAGLGLGRCWGDGPGSGRRVNRANGRRDRAPRGPATRRGCRRGCGCSGLIRGTARGWVCWRFRHRKPRPRNPPSPNRRESCRGGSLTGRPQALGSSSLLICAKYRDTAFPRFANKWRPSVAG